MQINLIIKGLIVLHLLTPLSVSLSYTIKKDYGKYSEIYQPPLKSDGPILDSTNKTPQKLDLNEPPRREISFSPYMINILLSILIGVFTSFAVWYFTFKKLVPKIRFSPKISKIPTDENNSGWRYRFKIENYGRRNMIDITVIVRLQIKGLKSYQSKNWQNIYLPTTTREFKNIIIVKPLKKSGRRVLVEIKTYECEYFQRNIFSEEIREASRNKSLILEDVLQLGTQAHFQIMLLGYDEFSGVRKLFLSNVYTIDDIVEGNFDTKSLNIKA